jgi:hypothetical protein
MRTLPALLTSVLTMLAPPVAGAQTTTNPFRPNYAWGDLPDDRAWAR